VPAGRNKGKTLPLPVIAPWQMMAALWIARRIWTMYGGQVKNRLRDVKHPLAGQIHDLLPDTGNANSGSASTPATAQAPVQPQPTSSAPQPAPQYQTQPLSSVTASNGNSHATTKLPSGSILSGLRGNS
jgi:hypothetical protein